MRDTTNHGAAVPSSDHPALTCGQCGGPMQREHRCPAPEGETALLPEGKCCADCAHFQRCHALLSRTGEETVCDWIPSRFRQHAIPTPAPGGGDTTTERTTMEQAVVRHAGRMGDDPTPLCGATTGRATKPKETINCPDCRVIVNFVRETYPFHGGHSDWPQAWRDVRRFR
jgi:hypothetical protein